MSSNVIGRLENISSLRDLEEFFMECGFKVKATHFRDDKAKKLFPIINDMPVIQQWVTFTDYKSDFQIYGLLFDRGNLLKGHMRKVMNDFKRQNLRPLVCFSDGISTIFSVLKTDLVDERNVRHRIVFLPVGKNALTGIQKLIIERLPPGSDETPREIAKHVTETIDLAARARDIFANYSVFSEHYLKTRLKDEPEWRSEVETAFNEVRAIFAGMDRALPTMNEAETYGKIVLPVLRILGYPESTISKAHGKCKLALKNPADTVEPLALCNVKYWGRPLDRVRVGDERDHVRNIHPGFEIVGDLQQNEDVEWGILTNGRAWRLYTKKTNCTATNYYEVDLDLLLRLGNPDEFKYFYLFFRAEAFTKDKGEKAFLERILEGSERYAKKLEANLKENVFEEVFPELAKGFMHYRKEYKEKAPEEETPGKLREIFHGTMRVLYRLLFLLYAESRDLLPARPGEPYYERSLLKECLEMQESHRNRELADDISQNYWNNLSDLFNIIDKGSRKYNVPKYNGGLFDQSLEENKFIGNHRMGDFWIERALRLLTFDDNGEGELIDYKDLGVRQLGSIYEGLLEFHLEIADEQLVVTKEKGKEVFKPVSKAKKLPKNPTYINSGEVYLVNTKKERKATGSYYTPDYIVKYIVKNTVGKIMDERGKQFDELMADTAKSPKQKREEAIETLLSLKVLDPAMGSGHFLVETVDYITDRIVGIMNNHPQNPFMDEIETIRNEIAEELEKSGVEIDPESDLKDTNIIKRMVMKRCIYGVDLNDMAVELAKLSLWLDSFTKGAPLSFLDHHLKCGNSLIGANLKDVGIYPDLRELKKKAKKRTGAGAAQQQRQQVGAIDEYVETTVPKPYIDKLLGAMNEMADLHDESVEGTKRKKETFRKIMESEEYRAIKAISDLNTSVFFGNEISKDRYNQLNWNFLKSEPGSRSLRESFLDGKVKHALALAGRKQFFHWELEFPEVFFEEGGEKENPGFDVVIGNPPWINLFGMRDYDRDYFRKRFDSPSGKYDIYVVFVEAGICLSTNLFGMIFPNRFLRSKYGKALRDYLISTKSSWRLIEFASNDVFEDATTYPCIAIAVPKKKEISIRMAKVNRHRPSIKDLLGSRYSEVSVSNFSNGKIYPDILGEKMKINPKITVLLSELVHQIGQGVYTGAKDIFVINDSGKIEPQILQPVVDGADLERFGYCQPKKFLVYPYHVSEGKIHLVDLEKYPKAFEYLSCHKSKLLERKFWGNTIASAGKEFYEIWNPSPFMFSAKIMYAEIASTPTFAVDLEGNMACLKTCYCIVFTNSQPFSLHYIVGLLNSKYLFYLLRQSSPTMRGGKHYRFLTQYVEKLPIRRINFTTPQQRRTQLVEEAKKMYFEELDRIVEAEAAE